MRTLLVFFMTGSLCAQTISQTPEASVYQGKQVWSHLAWRYLPKDVPHTQFYNSNRLDALMRAGNIYLSLQDAIALALENNLDIEYHRYDRRQAETDQLRASAGQLLRFTSNPARAGFNSASSGVLAGLARRRRRGPDRQQHGHPQRLQHPGRRQPTSPTWNLWPSSAGRARTRRRSADHRHRTGTNYLIVSSAHTTDYGIQKSFLTGTSVTLDMFQQSLSQNAPANEYNPSLTGNPELSVTPAAAAGIRLLHQPPHHLHAKNN